MVRYPTFEKTKGPAYRAARYFRKTIYIYKTRHPTNGGRYFIVVNNPNYPYFAAVIVARIIPTINMGFEPNTRVRAQALVRV